MQLAALGDCWVCFIYVSYSATPAAAASGWLSLCFAPETHYNKTLACAFSHTYAHAYIIYTEDCKAREIFAPGAYHSQLRILFASLTVYSWCTQEIILIIHPQQGQCLVQAGSEKILQWTENTKRRFSQALLYIMKA